jgi:hypothetical protein
LIYFGSEVQNQVVPIIHYCLRPGGYLFLGTSENVSQFDDLFVPLDKKHRIFRGRENSSRTVRLPHLLGDSSPCSTGIYLGPLSVHREWPSAIASRRRSWSVSRRRMSLPIAKAKLSIIPARRANS